MMILKRDAFYFRTKRDAPTILEHTAKVFICLFLLIPIKGLLAQSECEIYSLIMDTLKTEKDKAIIGNIFPEDLKKLDSLPSEIITTNFKFLIQDDARLLTIKDLVNYRIFKKKYSKRYKINNHKIYDCLPIKSIEKDEYGKESYILKVNENVIEERKVLVEMRISPLYIKRKKAFVYLVNRYYFNKSQDKFLIFYLKRKNIKSQWEVEKFKTMFHKNRNLIK